MQLEIVICRCDDEKGVQVEFVMPFSAGGGRLLQVEYGFFTGGMRFRRSWWSM